MSAETTWSKIITQIKASPIELPTTPSDKREPLWFRAYMEKGDLYIDNAVNHKPPTKMSMRRKISENDFARVYPYAQLRAKGDNSKYHEVTHLSKNTAYI